ncbi:unnamed protein product [Meganyctiphanes norvegica]|uniref:Poly [ADP-ribose] polymerase n=1 Tax=Meganyctiphanes norvegica TaxID=48144 RepID=A0AAV2QZL4_MEGNR
MAHQNEKVEHEISKSNTENSYSGLEEYNNQDPIKIPDQEQQHHDQKAHSSEISISSASDNNDSKEKSCKALKKHDTGILGPCQEPKCHKKSKNSYSSESILSESDDNDSNVKSCKPLTKHSAGSSDACQKPKYHKNPKNTYSSESILSESDDNNYKEKSSKPLRKHVSGISDPYHKPKYHNKSKTTNSSESLLSESGDNDAEEKSSKPLKKQATGISYPRHKPKYHKKSNKRDIRNNSMPITKKNYNRNRESESSDTNEDASKIYKGPFQHTSRKRQINTKQENFPLSSKSLINSLSMCPKFSESLLNLVENENILPKYVRKIVSKNSHIFTLSDNLVILHPKISICRQYLNQGCSKHDICFNLHICQQFVINNCKDSKCILGHNLTSNHNYNALKHFKIHKLSTEILLNILKIQICPAKPLKVCNKYNLGRCKNLKCNSLHVCLNLVQNNYRCKLNNCKLNHDLMNDTCLDLLADAGVSTNEAPRDVLAALWESSPTLCETTSDDNDQDNSKENAAHQKNTNETPINSLQNNESVVESVISTLPNTNSESVTSNDSLGSKDSYYESADTSPDSEFELFQWQVSNDGNQWVNMYHSQALRIEESFCDPKNENITISKLISPNIKSDRNDIDSLMGNNFWEAKFQSMLLLKDDQSDILYLRRQTVDLPQSQNHENIIFLWFFEDSDGKWLECSQDSDRKEKLFISVSSNEIEQNYINDSSIPLTLGNSYVSYILDFESMALLNLENNKKINVRRRPKPHLKNIKLLEQGGRVTLFDMTQNSNSIINNFPIFSTFSENNTTNNDDSDNIDDNIQISVASQKYSVWSHNPGGYVEIPEICYDSVEGNCKNEISGCKRLHAKLHFHWQVSEDSAQWLNMHTSHVICLEKAFCNPENDEVSIPMLDQSKPGYDESGSLIALGTEDTWKAKFQSMLLLNKSQTRILYLRRLTTESIAGQCIEPNLYLWYIKNVNDKWVQLGRNCIDDFRIDASSATIEGNFQHDSSSSMTIGNSSWVLDFDAMNVSNNETDIHYDVKRRPKPHLKFSEDDININEQQEGEDQTQSASNSISTISLPNTWDAMLPGEKSCRIPIQQTSTEFATVQDILPDSLQTKVTNIERIQNPFLWYAFQNKIREMSTTYEDDITKVNVMQLFHGTKPDVIGNICTENFDWRLHGSHTGQVYGRGTYFSTDATIGYRYCTSDSSGKLFLLLARVAVGTITLGDSTMVRPPLNAETGLSYDSTVNNLNNPTIIVKYDKQEYFPEYIITIE